MKDARLVPGLERVPGWDQLPWLRAGFSTRLGGRSQVYGEDEQNLGWTGEDDLSAIASNRVAFVQALSGQADSPLVTVRQVHGAVIRDLDSEALPLMQEGRAKLEGDGMISGTPGRVLAILTADCVPVLLADTRTHAVAAFHAGWRGTLAGIVAHGTATLLDRYGSDSGDLVAAIGPCIHACCFNVGEEVRSAFRQEFHHAEQLFTTAANGQLAMDLVEANRRQLLASGLQPGKISVLDECTACHRTAAGGRKYFSYRSERGVTGRMLSGIVALA